MKKPLLEYYMHDGVSAFRFELAGLVNEEGARELERAWRTAASVIGDRRLIVDITLVTAVDELGRALLVRWHREGAQLVANSTVSRALAESITGAAPVEPAVNRRAWLPFLTSFLIACTFPSELSAGHLKPETVAAWDEYVATASAKLQARVRPGGHFLWAFENAERAAAVRSGEIVVAPVSGHMPAKVPGGLVHHWTGAMFLPGLKLDDVLEVTRDYDHFKEFYRPSVVDSKTISRSGANDHFSLRLMNQAFFLKSALDADYEATNVRVDTDRFYSISRTTRVQEVEECGQAGEHRLPEGEGGGYIWKLFSIARLEHRDGGVYIEFEVVALSRDIPVATRFIVDPLIRRVSRNSLLTSLQQTELALHGNPALLAVGRPRIPTSAGKTLDLGIVFPA